MGYKSGEKQKWSSGFQIGRTANGISYVEIIPSVVQCHEYHDHSPQEVNRFNSVGFYEHRRLSSIKPGICATVINIGIIIY